MLTNPRDAMLCRSAKFGEHRTPDTAELLGIFDFQNGGRPPSWIWYDVIADHQRILVDGPNILIKLHVDPVSILREIAIFVFGPFDLKLPIHAHFWVVLGDMTGFPLELGTGTRGQKRECCGYEMVEKVLR